MADQSAELTTEQQQQMAQDLRVLNDAFSSLGISIRPESYAEDMSRVSGMLADLVGNMDGAGEISFDPSAGYTPEFGQQLLGAVEQIKGHDTYARLKDAYTSDGTLTDSMLDPGLQVVVAGIMQDLDIPQALKDDPARILRLMESAPAVIEAADRMHALQPGLQGVAHIDYTQPADATTETAETAPQAEEEPSQTGGDTVRTAADQAEIGIATLASLTNVHLAQQAEEGGGLMGLLSTARDKARDFLTGDDGGENQPLTQVEIPDLDATLGNDVIDDSAQRSLQQILQLVATQAGPDAPEALRQGIYTPEVGSYLRRHFENHEQAGVIKDALNGVYGFDASQHPDGQNAGLNYLISTMDRMHRDGRVSQEQLVPSVQTSMIGKVVNALFPGLLETIEGFLQGIGLSLNMFIPGLVPQSPGSGSENSPSDPAVADREDHNPAPSNTPAAEPGPDAQASAAVPADEPAWTDQSLREPFEQVAGKSLAMAQPQPASPAEQLFRDNADMTRPTGEQPAPVTTGPVMDMGRVLT